MMTLASTKRVSGGLVIHEHTHLLGVEEPLEVRTFITEGLAARGGQEVRFTISDDWADPAVDVALALLVRLDEVAGTPEAAALGRTVRFADEALARGAPLGVLYARPQAVAEVAAASSALVGVLLHEEELAIAESGLPARVLGRLSVASKWFPYPPIWDVREEPVLSLADQATSVLDRIPVPRVTVGDSRVTREGDRIVVSLPGTGGPKAMRALWGQFPDLPGFMLGAHLAPDADGQYVWMPGEDGLHATSASPEPPTRIGHSFIVWMQSDETLVRWQEDGVGVLLEPDGFAALRDALEGGDGLEIETDGGTLAIEFRS